MEENSLSQKACTPCKKGEMPLKGAQLKDFLDRLGEGWQVVEERYLEKEYLFPDFQKALDFANRIGARAEAECHHPDLYLSYGKMKVRLWTHKIGGLSENDFILAAKCDLLTQ